MGTLKEENEKLKAKVKELQSRINRLETDLFSSEIIVSRATEERNKLIAERKSGIPKISIDEIHFIDSDRPELYLREDISIHFESSDNKEASLIKAICAKSHLKRLASDIVTTDEIYDWLNKDDWLDIGKNAHKEFKNRLYHRIRHINERAKPQLNGHNLIVCISGGYKLNELLIKTN